MIADQEVPKFTEEQVDYMIDRTVNILLSNFENAEASPWIQYSFPRSDQDKIRTVFGIMFLRQFTYLARNLLTAIVPEILRRLVTFSERVENEYEGVVRGDPDWQKTLIVQLEREDVFVSREPERRYATPENVLLALTLLEVNLHSRDLMSWLNAFGFEVEVKRLDRIGKLATQYCHTVELKKCFELAHQSMWTERNFLKNKLKENAQGARHSERYQDFSKRAEDTILRKRVTNRAYLQLASWRKAYADLVNGFASLSGVEFLQKEWSHDRLFEIWALCEVLRGAKRRGVHVRPWSALFQKRGRPLFYLGESPLYYNTSLQIEDSEETVPELKRHYLRGTRPDIFVVNIHDLKSSIVVDMKNYRETSVDAHQKILGYMKNYDVDNGAVIYPIKLDANDLGLVNIAEKSATYVRSSTGTGSFTALTLTPGKESELENDTVVDTFADFLSSTCLT